MGIETLMVPACVLCSGTDVVLEHTYARTALVAEWARWPGVAIDDELRGMVEIPQWKCTHCGLVFFPAEAAGSGRLYEQLQHFAWYYLAEKWEHDEALRDVPAEASLCECGCGRGDFLARVVAERRASAVGLELNEDAARTAAARGLEVRCQSMESFAAERPGAFDIVCSFQVLEHVGNPGEHLRAARALLRPGGRLIVGLPNNDSFLGLENNPLDRPPHHVSRWSPRVLHAALPALGFRVLKIAIEPLTAFHARSFVEAHFRALLSPRAPAVVVRVVMNWRVLGLVEWLLVRTGAHRRLRGQTMYLLAERA